MKIETNKEWFFEALNKNRKEINPQDCKTYNEFELILEKMMEKDMEDYNIRLLNTEKKTTSLFFEKKVGKNRTDIFDTLIDM